MSESELRQLDKLCRRLHLDRASVVRLALVRLEQVEDILTKLYIAAAAEERP